MTLIVPLPNGVFSDLLDDTLRESIGQAPAGLL
jgi:hypothetical protein